MAFTLSILTVEQNTHCDACRKSEIEADNQLIELYARNRHDKHIIIIHEKCLAKKLARAREQHNAYAMQQVTHG